MNSATIVRDYFETNPEAKAGVNRAFLAYHATHREAGAHYFCGARREDGCRWCGRSRELVRHGDEDPKCVKRPEWADASIEGVIAREEALFDRVLDRAYGLAKNYDLHAFTGEQLARLHHSDGVDPSMLEIALMDLGCPGLRQQQHDDYLVSYAEHKKTGGRGTYFNGPVLVAKTL
jgi:hypothetical protein